LSDEQRILVIGQTPAGVRSAQLCNPPNLDEFKVVIWCPESLPLEWFAGFSSASVHRLGALIDWVKQGHSLVIVGAPPEKFETSFPNKSGGKTIFSPLRAEPFVGISYQYVSGKLMEYIGPSSGKNLFDVLSKFSRYDAVLESKQLMPLLKVSRTQAGPTKLVGGYRRIGKGIIVYLPKCEYVEGRNFTIQHFFWTISAIPDCLHETGDLDFPDWVDLFQTESEVRATAEISVSQDAIASLNAKIEEQKARVAVERLSKRLFVSTDEAFVDAVAAAFRELGLRVISGPRQRADLIIWDGRRLGAVEAKGLEGAARERNVGQANRWAADISVALASAIDDVAHDREMLEYKQKLTEIGVPDDAEVQCKGIMVIGTFRGVALDQRPESFPDPVSRVIARSRVCALSGIQLMSLVAQARSNPALKSTILGGVDKIY